MSVPPGTQINKARPTKVKEEGVTLPPVAIGAITTPPPIPNSTIPPVPSLERIASSELITDESCNIVVDTKNAPRFVFLCFLFLMLEMARTNADFPVP